MFSMKRIGMAFAFCILLIGCAKKEQPATPKTADELSIEGEEAWAMTHSQVKAAAEKLEKAIDAARKKIEDESKKAKSSD